MSDNSLKISQLPNAANVATTDKILVLRDPSGTPSVRTVNSSVFAANLTISNAVPANSAAIGIAGTVRYDDTYLYICIATNVWKRAQLNSW